MNVSMAWYMQNNIVYVVEITIIGGHKVKAIRRRLLVMAVIMLALIPVGMGTSAAGVIFYDDFNSENNGRGVTNYSNFAKWNVVGGGTVDLIGNGYFDFYPGNGLYVDLDGSSGNAGILSTKMLFTPGTYQLSFDLGNSPYGAWGGSTNPVNTVVISLGSWQTTLTRKPLDLLEPFTFTTTTSGFLSLSFQNLGGDNVGAILDNVQVSTVPEPGTILLIGTGLVGIASFRKRFRA
jgi:hypothetical protein